MDNRREDDGIYTCLISNKFEVIRHDIKVMVVANRPELHPNQPGNHSIQVGANLTMNCEPTTIDDPYYHMITWYSHFNFNGEWTNKTRVAASLFMSFSKYSPMGENIIGDGFKLILTNITKEEAGWYSCVVENPFGACVSYGYLNVTQPLEDPDTQFPILDTFIF